MERWKAEMGNSTLCDTGMDAYQQMFVTFFLVKSCHIFTSTDFRGKRPWPWGRVTIWFIFWGALTLSWYQKSSRYPKKSMMSFPEKKSDKGFFITASWSLVPKMFEPNCGWFGARFLLPNMGVGIQIVGLGMFSCYEWSLFCW